MTVIGRLDQYGSMIVAGEFDEYDLDRGENLFFYSEEFNQSSWVNDGSTETTNTTETLAPDGLYTAEKLIGTNGNGYRQSISQDANVTIGIPCTFSVFLKQAERRYATIFFNSTSVVENDYYGSTAYIDLQTGTIANGSTITKIVAYPNGWYRCYVTATPSSSGGIQFEICIGTANNTIDGAGSAAYQYTGNGTAGFYIWGAQVSRDAQLPDYVQTTTTRVIRQSVSANTKITGVGTYYSSGFDENIGITTALTANVFAPYDLVYDEFASVLYGPGKGTFMRQNADQSVIVYNEIDEVTPRLFTYVVSGTKAPTYGSGGGTYPPPNWTGRQNSSVDDSSLLLPTLPFNFTISNTAYTAVYLGSNSYITFGSGSGSLNVSASIPALNKLHFGSSDNSYQRVSNYVGGSDYVRVRYEGAAASSGIVGSPTIVVEITLFNPSLFGGQNVIELLVGNHGRTSGQFGIADTTTYYASGTISANQSYVFVGDSTGTSWVINTGSYVSGTGY